mmetsp:Transcript_6632/g.15609  ORF Transcript_6632/g.15609 Transcript_6632/m.15609 type:complete len:341 (-) Transcript_6632:288-1310(-)
MALGFRYKRRRSLAAAVCSSRSWRSRSSVSFSRREREAARRAAERRLSSSSSLALRSSSSTSHFCKASRARILSSSLRLSCDRCRTRSSALRRATASTESPRGRGAACAERSRGFLELSRLSARCDASSSSFRSLSCCFFRSANLLLAASVASAARLAASSSVRRRCSFSCCSSSLFSFAASSFSALIRACIWRCSDLALSSCCRRRSWSCRFSSASLAIFDSCSTLLSRSLCRFSCSWRRRRSSCCAWASFFRCSFSSSSRNLSSRSRSRTSRTRCRVLAMTSRSFASDSPRSLQARWPSFPESSPRRSPPCEARLDSRDASAEEESSGGRRTSNLPDH